MALTIKHPFVSPITDDAVPNEIGPTDWNATHTVTGTPDASGSDKQVQFNDGGTFGGDAGLTFDKATDVLSVGKQIILGDGTAASPAYAFGGMSGFYRSISGAVHFAISGNTRGTFFSNNFGLGSGMTLGWSPTVSSDQPPDVAISREATSVLQINSGTANDYRDLKLRTLTAQGLVSADALRLSNGSAVGPTYSFTSDSTTGFYRDSANGGWRWSFATNPRIQFFDNSIAMGSGMFLGWYNTATVPGTFDTSFQRTAAGEVTLSNNLKLNTLIASGEIKTANGKFQVGTNGHTYVIGSSGVNIANGVSSPTLEIQNAGGATPAFMTFHRSGQFAGFFGLDVDNDWKIGGFSYGPVSYKLLHESNSFTVASTTLLTTNKQVNFVGGSGNIANGSAVKLVVQSTTASDAAFMYFMKENGNAPSYYFGLDTDNRFKWGGAWAGANSYRFWTSGDSFAWSLEADQYHIHAAGHNARAYSFIADATVCVGGAGGYTPLNVKVAAGNVFYAQMGAVIGEFGVLNENMSVYQNWGPYPCGSFCPHGDNTTTCGFSTGYRWSSVWSATGTIQTSDARLKTDIKDSRLGLQFIEDLRPVSYKWIEGGKIAKRVPEGEEEESPAVLDEEGNVIVPAKMRIKYRKEDDFISTPGVRTHWGLIAQEVKVAIDKSGVEDFAGYVKEELHNPESILALRYEEFIAPLIAAVQELSARVKELEAQVAAR